MYAFMEAERTFLIQVTTGVPCFWFVHTCSNSDYLSQHPPPVSVLLHITLSVIPEARQMWTPPAQAPWPMPRREMLPTDAWVLGGSTDVLRVNLSPETTQWLLPILHSITSDFPNYA